MYAETLTVQYSAVGLVPGIADPVTIYASVKFSDDSSVVQGQGLWKLSMYGSRNDDGTGKLCVSQDIVICKSHFCTYMYLNIYYYQDTYRQS